MDAKMIHRMSHNLKCVVLIEQKPLTDKFWQITLDDDQYKLFTHFLWQLMVHSENGAKRFDVNKDREFDLKDIPQTFTRADINEKNA